MLTEIVSLQIMYTIHGEKDMEEIELSHLSGHKNSRWAIFSFQASLLTDASQASPHREWSC